MNFVPKAKEGLLGYVFDNVGFFWRVDGVSSSKGVLPTCLARDVTVSKVTLKAVVSMSQMCRSDTLAASASLPRDKPIAFRATWRLRANVWQISHGSLAGTSPVSAFTRLAFTSVQSPESVTRIKPLAHRSASHQARCNTPRLP